MPPRRPPSMPRARPLAVLFVGWLAAMALAVALIWPGRPAAAAALKAGHWTSFAHGNDILALRAQGPVLWVGTRIGGLVRWDEGRRTYRQFLRPQDPLAGNTVRDIALDAAGRKWLATDRGLTVFDDKGTPDEADDAWFSYSPENTAGGLPSPDVRALAWDGPRLWVGTAQVWDSAKGEWRGGGVARLDTKGTADHLDDSWAGAITFAGTRRVAPDGTETVGLASDTINDLALSKDGDLWIATGPHWLLAEVPEDNGPSRVWVRVHGGLSRLETAGTPDRADDNLRGFSCEDAAIITCQVAAVVVDGQDRGWAALQGRGLMSFDAASSSIQDDEDHLFPLPDRAAAGDVVLSLALADPGQTALANTVWVGRSKGGLSVLDHRGSVRNQRDDRWNFERGGSFTTADGLRAGRVQAVVVQPEGAWLGLGPRGAMGSGLQRLDLEDLTVEAPLLTDRAPASNFVAAIAVGQPGSRFDGQVFVGLGSRSQAGLGGGLAQLSLGASKDASDDRWALFTTAGTDGDGKAPWSGLAGDNVQAVLLHKDRAWVGSLETVWNPTPRAYSDGGLSVYDGTAWTARTHDPLTAATPSAPGLKDGSVSALAAACDDSLWIGTGNPFDGQGAGVHVLRHGPSVHQKTGDQWSQFTYPALTSDNTAALDIDCAQNVAWVASRHHVTKPDAMGGAGGQLFGGGVARYDLTAKAWERSDTRQGLESFTDGTLYAEALAVLAAPSRQAWVGTFGTRTLTQRQLLAQTPFYAATLNLGQGATWRNRQFPRAGMVSALERDPLGRLWVATTRGGMAREGLDPESWRSDLEPAGLFVFQGDGMDAEQPTSLPQMNESLVANDIAALAIGQEDEVWIGTEGWGLMRYRENGAPPTPTATFPLPATPTSLPATATDTPRPTVTGTPPTPEASLSPEVTPTQVGTRPTPKRRIFLPRLQQTRAR